MLSSKFSSCAVCYHMVDAYAEEVVCKKRGAYLEDNCNEFAKCGQKVIEKTRGPQQQMSAIAIIGHVLFVISLLIRVVLYGFSLFEIIFTALFIGFWIIRFLTRED